MKYYTLQNKIEVISHIITLMKLKLILNETKYFKSISGQCLQQTGIANYVDIDNKKKTSIKSTGIIGKTPKSCFLRVKTE